jgi:hypothetical protein
MQPNSKHFIIGLAVVVIVVLLYLNLKESSEDWSTPIDEAVELPKPVRPVWSREELGNLCEEEGFTVGAEIGVQV